MNSQYVLVQYEDILLLPAGFFCLDNPKYTYSVATK